MALVNASYKHFISKTERNQVSKNVAFLPFRRAGQSRDDFTR